MYRADAEKHGRPYIQYRVQSGSADVVTCHPTIDSVTLCSGTLLIRHSKGHKVFAGLARILDYSEVSLVRFYCSCSE